MGCPASELSKEYNRFQTKQSSSAFSGETIMLTATMIIVVVIVNFRWLNF